MLSEPLGTPDHPTLSSLLRYYTSLVLLLINSLLNLNLLFQFLFISSQHRTPQTSIPRIHFFSTFTTGWGPGAGVGGVLIHCQDFEENLYIDVTQIYISCPDLSPELPLYLKSPLGCLIGVSNLPYPELTFLSKLCSTYFFLHLSQW